MAIDPFRDFTRPKLSDSAPPAFPDRDTLKIRILQENFIGWLFQTNWMQEVTAAMDSEEEQELQEHIQSYLDGLRDDAKFKLVSCDRYSMEGYEGSKVISTRALKKGESVVGVVGRTCPVSEDHEKELALRGVDTSCVIKSSRFCLFIREMAGTRNLLTFSKIYKKLPKITKIYKNSG